MIGFSNTVEDVFRLILCIASIGTIVSATEWLSLWHHFKEDGFYSWKIRKIRSSVFLKYTVFNYLYSYPYVLMLLLIQVIAALTLLMFNQNFTVLSICSFIIATISILFSLRSYVGYTGADQMLKIIFTTASLCFVFKTKETLSIGLTFLAIQLIIAYATPGVLRLFEKGWKNGTHLLLITRQHTYGNKTLYEILKSNNRLRIAGSWAIVLFEFGILFAFLLPPGFLLLYLFVGIVFHLTNAIIMGLNIFPWAFVAVYPAYFWFSVLIRTWIF